MKNRFSGKRLAYLGALVSLLVPLSVLGRPSTITARGERDDVGGVLAQIRDEHRLQHSNLGDLDPSTITLKLATFGVRQVAAALLRNKAEEHKSKQNWTALEATLDQAANLQPYYVGPWRYQAWNLSYNVSVEFDGWEGRYHYVKRGIKYLIRGSRINRNEHRLKSDIGWFTGQKFGRSDERVPFRRKFRTDNDEEYPAHNQRERPERDRDNWLVAREYYQQAEDIVENSENLGTVSPVVFYSQGPRCRINYAEALGRREEIERVANSIAPPDVSKLSDEERTKLQTQQRELVERGMAAAWTVAAEEWDRLGRERVLPTLSRRQGRLGADFLGIQIAREEAANKRLAELAPDARMTIINERLAEMSDEDRRLVEKYFDLESPILDFRKDATRGEDDDEQSVMRARQNLLVTNREIAERAPADRRAEANDAAEAADDARILIREVEGFREQANYDYWLNRCQMESSPEAIAARQSWHAALVARDGGDLIGSQRAFEDSFDHWKIVIEEKFKNFYGDVILREELMDAISQYGNVIQQRGVPFPEDEFVLMKWMMDSGVMAPFQMNDPEAFRRMQERRTQQEGNQAQPAPQ